jgi:hypothetical protein
VPPLLQTPIRNPCIDEKSLIQIHNTEHYIEQKHMTSHNILFTEIELQKHMTFLLSFKKYLLLQTIVDSFRKSWFIMPLRSMSSTSILLINSIDSSRLHFFSIGLSEFPRFIGSAINEFGQFI